MGPEKYTTQGPIHQNPLKEGKGPSEGNMKLPLQRETWRVTTIGPLNRPANSPRKVPQTSETPTWILGVYEP